MKLKAETIMDVSIGYERLVLSFVLLTKKTNRIGTNRREAGFLDPGIGSELVFSDRSLNTSCSTKLTCFLAGQSMYVKHEFVYSARLTDVHAL
jgi:hypothetical protein